MRSLAVGFPLTGRFSSFQDYPAIMSCLRTRPCKSKLFEIGLTAISLMSRCSTLHNVADGGFFRRSPDMKEQLFFHYSEVVKPEDFKGSMLAYFKEQLATGDEVEFAIGPGRGNKAVGQKVGHFLRGSTFLMT